MVGIIGIAHIQGDFEEAAAESGEFYINVDETPDHIEEFRIRRADNNDGYVVSGNDNEEDNSFQKLKNGHYEAVLKGRTFIFQVPLQKIEEQVLGMDCDLESGDATEKYIAIGDSNGNIIVYDHDWNKIQDLEQAHQSDITVTKFFPSGEVILSGSNDMQIKVWSVNDGSNPRTLQGHSGAITDTILIDRGRNILSSSTDGSVRLWELGSGKTIHAFYRRANKLDPALCMALLTSKEVNIEENPLEFGTNGKRVLIGHKSGTMTLHDLASKEQVAEFPNLFMSSCTSVVSITDNLVVSGYENGSLALWDIEKPESCVQRLSIKNNYAVNKLHLHKKKIFVSCGIDTVFSIEIKGEELVPSSVTHLVNSDIHITHFVNMPCQNQEKLLMLGKWGYCSLFDL